VAAEHQPNPRRALERLQDDPDICVASRCARARRVPSAFRPQTGLIRLSRQELDIPCSRTFASIVREQRARNRSADVRREVLAGQRRPHRDP